MQKSRLFARIMPEGDEIMLENIEKTKLLSCCAGVSPAYKKVTVRKTNVLVIWLTGPVVYDFGDHSVTLGGGEMLLIPRGTSYTIRSPEESVHKGVYFWFQGDLTESMPRVYPMEHFSEAGQISTHLASRWQSGDEPERLNCLRLFYSLLTHIAAAESAAYAERKKYRIIAPAVGYLRENLFSSDLKTEELHRLCGISDTYFRRIFLSEFGMTPQKYIITKRLSYAKAILDSGNFETIAQVAAAAGYTDPLYFSQSFRKKYGFPPSRY